MLSLPKSRQLRRILLAYTINQVGTWFGYVALSLSVYDHTHSALAVAAMFIAARGLPALLAPPLVASAEFSERYGRIGRLYLAEAIVALALAALLWHFWLPGLLFLVAIDGTAALAASALLRASAAHAAVEGLESDSDRVAPRTRELDSDRGAPGMRELDSDRGAPGTHELDSDRGAPGMRELDSDRGAPGMRELDSDRGAPGTHELDSDRVAPRTRGSGTSDGDAVAVAQRQANAALNFAFTGTLAIVPVIAGGVIAVAGAPTALLVDAATFAIGAVLLWGLRSHVEDATGASARQRLLAAWRYLREVPQLRSLLLTEAFAVVFFASVEPVEVLYAKQTLGVGDRGFGILIDAWGVGMVLGGIVFARAVRRPLGPMLVVGTLLVGLSYLGFAAAPTLALACAAALIGGAGNGAQWPSLISAVQQLSPKALHGRLMSAVESIGSLCPALGFALGGAITSLTSPRTAMLAAGLAATAITVLFVRISRLSFHLTGDTDPSPAFAAAAGTAPPGAASPTVTPSPTGAAPTGPASPAGPAPPAGATTPSNAGSAAVVASPASAATPAGAPSPTSG
ncbi:MAG TPA: MFS transporter [Solirubrobacteraceae bacterium]|nr:MFS transporter [Solirubrobacteraceae bacterium]